jgi:hypothetical protein
MNARDLHFYHGTGAAATARILWIGARNVIDEMGWRPLASDIYSALLDLATPDELGRQMRQHKDLLEGPGLSPLRSAAGRLDGVVAFKWQRLGQNPIRRGMDQSPSYGWLLASSIGWCHRR